MIDIQSRTRVWRRPECMPLRYTLRSTVWRHGLTPSRMRQVNYAGIPGHGTVTWGRRAVSAVGDSRCGGGSSPANREYREPSGLVSKRGVRLAFSKRSQLRSRMCSRRALPEDVLCLAQVRANVVSVEKTLRPSFVISSCLVLRSQRAR